MAFSLKKWLKEDENDIFASEEFTVRSLIGCILIGIGTGISL